MMVRALRAVALLLRSERLGVGSPISLLAFASDLYESVLLWGFKQVEKTGETVKDDELDDTPVEH